MKLEAGKYYKTRDGRKVYMVGRAPETILCPFIGVIEERADSWMPNGSWGYMDGEQKHYKDLVEPWPEKLTLKQVTDKICKIAYDIEGRWTMGPRLKVEELIQQYAGTND